MVRSEGSIFSNPVFGMRFHHPVAKRQSHPLDTGRSHATSLRHPVLNFIVSGKQMEQIEPALFATLKQDAAILRSTRAFYHKGGSSQLYCHELVAGTV
jgi:hypothetical protein